MKKLALATIIAALALSGCSSQNVRNVSQKKVTWEHAGNLPAQKGFEKNHGVAGVLSGTLEGKYVVVGGGANFPYKPVAVGGAKQLYSDIYLLKETGNKLEVVEQVNWKNEIGYGASVTTKDGIYYIGGGATPESNNDILFLSMNAGKLDVKKIGDLPFTIQNGGAVEKDGKLYIYAGSQEGKGSNKMYEYDLANGNVKELASVPGATTRNQSVSQILNGKLYVFSGGSNIAYTDGYAYTFETNTWEKVADVALNGKGISLLGANSVKLNENEMMVIGGFNREVYDDAVANLSTLKGEKLNNFKAGYFGADPDEFNWNREVLVYNAKENTWKTMGQIPFNAPCGEGLTLIGNKVFSINGEIKPGVRTDRMYVGKIVRK